MNWNDVALLLGINAVVCSAGILLSCFVMFRARRLLLLPAALAFFLVTNGLTQGAPLWFDLGIAFPTAPVIYQRALAVDLIVVAIAIPFLLVLGVMRPGSSASERPLSGKFLTAVTLLAVAASGYFVFRNREVLPLVRTLYSTSGYGDYLDLRNQIGDVINSHRLSGAAPANWAFAVFCPFLFFAVPGLPRTKAGAKVFWLGLIGAAMLAPALLIGGRSQIFFVFTIPILAFALRRIDSGRASNRNKGAWRLVLGGLGVAAAGGLVFQFFYRESFLFSLGEFAARALGAPGAVAGCYYLAFPEFFPFRGWSGIMMFPIRGETLDFHIISLATNGLDANANASFAATAYSGAGLAGVALAAFLIFGAAASLDFVLLRLPPRLANALGFSSLISASTISSLPAMISINTYGFILGPLCILVLSSLIRMVPKTFAWRVS
jgi:hypothetical protein